jgi:hypothetical protein
MLNRTALKVNGSKKAMAFCTITKVVPQIKATSSKVRSANKVVLRKLNQPNLSIDESPNHIFNSFFLLLKLLCEPIHQHFYFRCLESILKKIAQTVLLTLMLDLAMVYIGCFLQILFQ